MNTIKDRHAAIRLLLSAAILTIMVSLCPPMLSAQDVQNGNEEITAMILHDAKPMHFRDERTGNASGFAVECLGIVAKRAGFTVTYKFGHDFAEIIGKLRTGEVDILPSLAVSEERRKSVDFTEPIDSSATMLFVRARDTSVTGLQSGLRIGVVQGSIMQEQLKNNQDILLISYRGFSDALFDLLAGQIDGMVSSESTIWGMARDAGVEDKIRTVGPSMGDVIRSMAVRKGNARLLDMLNRELKDFVGSPEYQQIYAKWYAKKPSYWTPKKIFIVMLVLTASSIFSLAYWRYRSIVTLNNSLLRTIDEKEKAEEALKESRRSYELLAENLPGIVCRVYARENDRVHFFNDMADKLTGYSSQDLSGTACSLESITMPEDKEHIAAAVGKALKKKGPFSMEYRIRRKDGVIRHVLEHGTPLYGDDGELQYIDRVIFDITDRSKMAEELLKVQKLESVGILAGGIAHDFNNLLTSIVGNISLAKLYTNEQQESYRWLTGAEKASERAADLTRQLLTFSKGGKPVRMTASIVEPLKEAVEFTLSGSKVLSEFDIPRDIWNVEADIGQMSQVFHNLVINAMQAMPEGGRLTASIRNIELGTGDLPALRDGRYVRITISDTGMGIPPEHLSKVFDPYFTTKQSGSGLGLSTVFSIIKNHDGHITLESSLSKGTSFNIYLPASDHIDVPIREEDHNIRIGGGKVLVMDDEAIVQGIAGDMMKSLGYEVEFASDGHEALAKYKKSLEENVPFDVVIMDLTIPGGMGGKETIQELLDLDPKARAIVSSGYSDDPLIADYQDYGFMGALAKPYRLRELSSTIRSALEDRAPD